MLEKYDMVKIKQIYDKNTTIFTGSKKLPSYENNSLKETIEGYLHNKIGIITKNTGHYYSIFIKNYGEVSWFFQEHLTLIAKGKKKIYERWKTKEEDEDKLKSDIKWIFDNPKDFIENPHGESLKTLGKCMGIENLWGPNGEGIVYAENALLVYKQAKPFIENKDYNEWLTHSEDYKRKIFAGFELDDGRTFAFGDKIKFPNGEIRIVDKGYAKMKTEKGYDIYKLVPILKKDDYSGFDTLYNLFGKDIIGFTNDYEIIKRGD